MNVQPPGTTLQLIFLRERLQKIKPGKFIEIGPGSGEVTNLLLELGWDGCSLDLEEKTISKLQVRFSKEIRENRFRALCSNYLLEDAEKADIVISCMVMEHLNNEEINIFMRKTEDCLCDGGLLIGLVPASPSHWGIEDDIAGHCRRYTRETIVELMSRSSWELKYISGLTFPVSNILLPISNYLVNKEEKSKLVLSRLEKTKYSGARQIKYKTFLPSILVLIVNRYTLYPFHILQKIFSKNKKSLVLYFEAYPIKKSDFKNEG